MLWLREWLDQWVELFLANRRLAGWGPAAGFAGWGGAWFRRNQGLRWRYTGELAQRVVFAGRELRFKGFVPADRRVEPNLIWTHFWGSAGWWDYRLIAKSRAGHPEGACLARAGNSHLIPWGRAGGQEWEDNIFCLEIERCLNFPFYMNSEVIWIYIYLLNFYNFSLGILFSDSIYIFVESSKLSREKK